MNLDYFLHLYPCKIDKDNQDLLNIKSCSIKEREKLSKQGGDEDATEEGDSGTINPKSFDCTCKYILYVRQHFQFTLFSSLS